MFKFFFGTDGKATVRRGGSNRWQSETDATGIRYVLNLNKRYYMMEVAIPWSMLGEACAPPSSREMRMNIQVRDRRSNALLFETIPEALDKASWTWPEMTTLLNVNLLMFARAINVTHLYNINAFPRHFNT